MIQIIPENLINEFEKENNKLKNHSENLKKIAKTDKMNTLECKATLSEIKTTIRHIERIYNAENYNSEQIEKSGDSTETHKQTDDPVIQSYNIIINHIDAINKLMDCDVVIGDYVNINPFLKKKHQSIALKNDLDMRNDIYDIITNIDAITHNYSLATRTEKEGIQRINELINHTSINLDANWAVAACFLSAIDICIHKRRKDLNLFETEEKEKKIPFKTRYEELIKKMESNKHEISKGLKALPGAFWIIRNNVIHEGYCPEKDELELITKWSTNIINALTKQP